MDFGKFEFTEIQKQKICELRTLIENCNQLNIGTEDDVLLTKYLYSTDWNVENAFICINNYYTFKLKNPKWLSNRPLCELMKIFGVIKPRFVLTKPDKDGRVIMICHLMAALENFPNFFFDLAEFDDLIFEAILSTPRGQQNGICMIYDFTCVTMDTIKVLTPSKMKLINKKNDAMPIRNRILHIVQKGFLMNLASTIVLPFITKTMRDNIHVHDIKNLDKLRNLVGYENLPAAYGGPPEYTMEDNNFAYELIEKNWDYLKNLQDYKKID